MTIIEIVYSFIILICVSFLFAIIDIELENRKFQKEADKWQKMANKINKR